MSTEQLSKILKFPVHCSKSLNSGAFDVIGLLYLFLGRKNHSGKILSVALNLSLCLGPASPVWIEKICFSQSVFSPK